MTEITLAQILTAREERLAMQGELLARWQAPLVCFTMNMAGPVKRTPASHRAFLWGCGQLRLDLSRRGLPLLHAQIRSLPTGDEGYFSVHAPAEVLKELCVELEEAGPMGRLFDMDVIGTDGKKLDRGKERSCLICGRPGRGCASRRVHPVEELQAETARRLCLGLFLSAKERVGRMATRALLEEVAVTPKPGLVDRENNGAHRDMDYGCFLASASALAAGWERCVSEGWDSRQLSPSQTFARLRPLGKRMEQDMLAATGGINTHKGAIFTLGVLCGALGRLWTPEKGFPETDRLLAECAAMTGDTLERELAAAKGITAGERLYLRYGVRGIRGQMAGGLPAVRDLALPLYRSLLDRGIEENHAAAVTLLRLIVNVEDTNLLHRGGPGGAAWARAAVNALLEKDPIPSLDAIRDLDGAFQARRLSPGGCADLLAVTLFLVELENEKTAEDGD